MSHSSKPLRSPSLRSPRHPWRVILAILLGGGLGWGISFGPAALAAEPVLHERFEGPEPTWQVRPTRNGTQLLRQTRTLASSASEASESRTVEQLAITCPGGYSTLLEHLTGKLPVLDELSLEVTLRSNRASLQLSAEVVFPRSLDRATNQPLRTLVYSSRYSRPGQWQTLHLTGVPLLTERHARLLRSQPGQEVDVREAFVDRVVLVVPGGEGESLVEVDQLKASGVMAERSILGSRTIRHSGDDLKNNPGNDSNSSNNDPNGNTEGPLLQAATGGKSPSNFPPVDIRRRGDTLTVAGAPLVPRMLEYHGERLSLVAQMGFNAIWMHEVPTEAELRAAHQAHLWIVCPPPEPAKLSAIQPTSAWQTVLAWSLGGGRDGLSLDQVASLADETRQHDPLQRPLMVEAVDQRRRYGQLADVVVSRIALPLPGDLLSSDKAPHVLPLLGCSQWTSIELQWSPEATAQCQLLAPRASHLGWHEPRTLYQRSRQSIAGGTRGLVIRSRERIGGNEPEARRMALQLQLLNSELAILEPWIVGGKRMGGVEIEGSSLARNTSQAKVTATMWQLGRSRLILVPARPLVPNDSPTPKGRPQGLSVMGVPETATAHLLTAGGLLPLKIGHAPGGVRISTGDLSAGGLVLLTNDPRSVAQWKKRLGQGAEAGAKAMRVIAVAERMRLELIESQLTTLPTQPNRVETQRLKQVAEKCDLLLAARNYPHAAQLARHLRRAIAQQELRLFAQAAKQSSGLGLHQSVPTQYSLRTLPTHIALEKALQSLPRGTNLLSGGDFENLEQAMASGWVHANYANSPLETSVEIRSASSKHGKASLRLTAQPARRMQSSTSAPPKPVVWITSPPVLVRPHSVIEITGWARVTNEGTSVNRAGELLVIDSLGGQQLKLTIPATRGWQPFRLVRSVGEAGQLHLNLALNGPATADIDAVMIREVVRPVSTALVP